jgi:hypothetical protein
MTQYQVLYWKDIPAQVKVFDGRRPLSRPLPDRFQVAIDRIATQEGLIGTDAYLEQWRWSEKRERKGTPQEVLQVLLRELEAEGDRLIEEYLGKNP